MRSKLEYLTAADCYDLALRTCGTLSATLNPNEIWLKAMKYYAEECLRKAADEALIHDKFGKGTFKQLDILDANHVDWSISVDKESITNIELP